MGAAAEPNPESVVRAFFESWNDLDSVRTSIQANLAEDVVWEQTGLPTARGVEQAVAMVDSLGPAGFTALTAEVRALAADGRTVLTERIDRMMRADGTPAVEFAVMGILELDENLRIVRWREYFDTSLLGALQPAT